MGGEGAQSHHGDADFRRAEEGDIREYLKKAGLPEDSKSVLYDGRTGQPFENRVMVGQIYMLKLAHMVDDKITRVPPARIRSYNNSPWRQGPVRRSAARRDGGWALEAYGAAYTLQELLTVKSDACSDAPGLRGDREGINTTAPGIPESFNVLVQELRGLALDVKIYDENGSEISLSEWSEGFSKPKRKIKIDTLQNI